MQKNTALDEPNSLSVDYPLDYCPQALWFTLALHILRPTFHILDKDFVQQEGATPDDSGSKPAVFPGSPGGPQLLLKERCANATAVLHAAPHTPTPMPGIPFAVCYINYQVITGKSTHVYIFTISVQLCRAPQLPWLVSFQGSY